MRVFAVSRVPLDPKELQVLVHLATASVTQAYVIPMFVGCTLCHHFILLLFFFFSISFCSNMHGCTKIAKLITEYVHPDK